MDITITIGGTTRTLSLEARGDERVIRIDDREYHVRSATLADGVLNFFLDDRPCRAFVSRGDDGIYMAVGGRSYVMEEEDDGTLVAGGHHGGDGRVEAPMPGNIVAVSVEPGATVEPGAPLVVLESMKMQNEITSPVAGEVTSVNCAVGDQVSFGAVLVEIEPAS